MKLLRERSVWPVGRIGYCGSTEVVSVNVRVTVACLLRDRDGMHCAVPVEYFSPLDENGRRRDADERPELSCGSVEFVAPTEYMVRPPMPPVYFFLIDVSLSAVKSGMVKVSIGGRSSVEEGLCLVGCLL